MAKVKYYCNIFPKCT